MTRVLRLVTRSALACLTGAAVVAGLVTGTAGATPAAGAKSAGPGTVVGSLGSCTTTKGALVGVDFRHWSGPIVRGCDPAPTTGAALLTTAGFTLTGTQHDGPAFICRIGHPLFNNGTQYPTPAQDACVHTPPASAYWSYWLAAKGKNTWTYSPLGAYSDVPKSGEVEAWVYGATDVSGATGQPKFTPNQVRAGLPTKARAVPVQRLRAAQAQVAAATPAAARAGSVNVRSAIGYLVANLVDGTHYEPFGGGFADFGLTMDGALALAATGRDDPALGRIVDFLDNRGKDGAGRTVDDYTGIGTAYAGGGSIGKEALVAESTGYSPRSFSGHDLIAALDDLVCAKADGAPNYRCAGAGNYAYTGSTFGQALGIMAQLRAGDKAGAARPIAYLESLQHADGAFPSTLPGTDSETDSTGIAAMALALVPGAKARIALARALHWLAAQQSADGGFPGAAGDSVNSAGIAAQALTLDAGTYVDRLHAARKFLGAEQNSDGGFSVAAGADPATSDVRASTQALGGAIGTPFGSLLDSLPAKATAASGADYLVSQLIDGDHYATTYAGTSYDDQGLTADGLFALLAAGGHAATVRSMAAYLAGQVEAYADVDGSFGGPYSGGVAKLALVADATGGDPHSFGGSDLLAILRSHVCTAATTDGSCTAAGDFVSAYSTVSQALGVLALQASPDAADRLSATSPQVVRLHQLQCADGGFSSALITPGGTCTSDVDTTGFAVQALAAVRGTDTWLGAAQSYLQKVQRSTGLFQGASGHSANSTALAAGALQTLVTALLSPVGSASSSGATQPQTITPIVAWQSALTGLDSLAVAGGGFRISSATSGADLRSSTQAVAAVAQVDLLAQSGAMIRSLPRSAASPGGTTSPSSGSSSTTSSIAASSIAPSSPAPVSSSTSAAIVVALSTSSTGGHAVDAASAGLAQTGVPNGTLLGWAAALLMLGVGLALAGRQRRTARYRGAHR